MAPTVEASAAMQSVNREAPTPLFMVALFGTAAASVGLGVIALRRRDDPASPWLLAGMGLYLVGLVLTIVYHIPRNNAVDVLDPTSEGVGAVWQHYASGWTAWNHVRTFTSLAGATAFTVALTAD